ELRLEPRGGRGRQIVGHDLRGATVERERRDQHPPVADRNELGHTGGRLLLEQRNWIPLGQVERRLACARRDGTCGSASRGALCCRRVLDSCRLLLNRSWCRHDARLAQRWSKAVAVTFAVGAVTGTVLSFEFGLLWPAFTGRFGQVFGLLFAIEGICFFLEAIFIAIYIFGWKRLSPWAHFWTGVPVVIAGLGGAFSVVAVNSWMNQPQGYSPTSGTVTSVEPLKVIFNPAVRYEVPHMILAAYLVTGFIVASIYAVGMLRGRRAHIHRLGLLIPLPVACIATPIQFAVGDTAARSIAKDQPIKFAAMECVQTTSTDVT